MRPFKKAFKRKKKYIDLSSLEGEKIKLRKLTVRDAVKISELLASNKVSQRFFVTERIDVDDIAMRLLESVPLYDNHTFLVWAIVSKQDPKTIIGEVSIKHLYPEDRICSIDFWIGSRYFHTNALKDTIRVVTKYLIEEHNLHRIQVKLKKEDELSDKILLECGFQFEGVQRGRRFFNGNYYDLNTYAILGEDVR